MNLIVGADLSLSLQDKGYRMPWKGLNRNSKLPKTEPLKVTWLIQGKDSKHESHPGHLLKSEEDIRVLPDIPCSMNNHIRDIPEGSRGTFYLLRNIIVQCVPEKVDYDILKWNFIKQSLWLKNILTQQMVRLATKDGKCKP